MRLPYIFFFVLISCIVASGHLDNGQDIVVDGYKIDFGFSPKIPNTNENTVLAFDIINLTTDEAIEPTSVWIRIAQDDKILFAGNLHPKNKQASVSFLFPSPGQYDITARFEKDNLVLAQIDLDIIVKEENNYFVYGSLVVLIFLMALGFLMPKRKYNSKNHDQKKKQ